MQLFYEIFPVFLFFVVFKMYGIYAATIAGMVTTFVQVIFTRLWQHKWDKKQLVTLAIFALFGGMTLYFHDPIFVKWKPTVIYWIFALVIFVSFFTAKPLMQRLTEGVLDPERTVPLFVWKRLSIAWAVFFSILGFVNLYIAYTYDSDTWVKFKFYGVTSALLLLSFIQALYLMRYLNQVKKQDDA